jgi:hypothetical protein
MPAARHPGHATGLWALVVAVGFALVGGCGSGDEPTAAGPSEVAVKAQQNMADFMKTQPKSKTAKKGQ